MTVIQEIPEVFESKVGVLTESLTGIELQKVESKSWNDTSDVAADIIRIKGYCQACIVCEAKREMFHQIISAMSGGSLPPEEERALYINEYMNILCGQLVSKLNELTGKSSRLTVPEYYVNGVSDISFGEWAKYTVLMYHARQGDIRFTIHYTVQ